MNTYMRDVVSKGMGLLVWVGLAPGVTRITEAETVRSARKRVKSPGRMPSELSWVVSSYADLRPWAGAWMSFSSLYPQNAPRP